MPGLGSTSFPMIEDVFLLARVHVNDTFKGATGTPGEGRIFIDTAPFMIPILNSAIADYQRDLDNAGIPTNTKEVYFLASANQSIPPVNGPNGVGVPDPSIQQNLNFTGFFDGLNNTAKPVLPADIIAPKKLWERSSGTGLTFTRIERSRSGLPSRYQDFSLGMWEWRQDGLWWNGALITKEMRMRYTARAAAFGYSLSPTQFASTPIPLLDSLDPLSLLCAEKFCAARLSAGATSDLLGKYQVAKDLVIAREVKDLQSITYDRGGYGDDEGAMMFGNW